MKYLANAGIPASSAPTGRCCFYLAVGHIVTQQLQVSTSNEAFKDQKTLLKRLCDSIDLMLVAIFDR